MRSYFLLKNMIELSELKRKLIKVPFHYNKKRPIRAPKSASIDMLMAHDLIRHKLKVLYLRVWQ